MEILDIKNDLARVLYSPLNDKKLMLSDFLVIQDANEIIFAQIINIETSRYEDCNIAVLKFILTYNPKTNNVMTYNGYVPSKSSELKYLNPVDIVKHIRKGEKVINWGNLLNTRVDLKTDLNILNENFFIECDNKRSTQIINNNIIETLNELNEKVVVVDFENRFKNKCAKNIKVGEDIKIPFNVDAFDYIIQNDIGLGAYENRIVVEGILLELQSYVKTLESKFLPFKTLEKVIEDEFCKTKLPEMGLFRNKLIKYSRQNIFAQYDSEITILNNYIEDNNVTIINTYHIDESWKKLVLNSIVESITTPCYFIVILDDINSNKKTLEKIYANQNIKPILSTSYLYKENFYIKTSSANGVLFKQQERSRDFATYSSFIHKLGLNEYIIQGEATYDIPFILKLKKFDFERERMIDEQIKADVDSIMQRGSLSYFSNDSIQNYKPLEKKEFDMKSFDEKNIYDENQNSFLDMTVEEAINKSNMMDAEVDEEEIQNNISQKEEVKKENIIENVDTIVSGQKLDNNVSNQVENIEQTHDLNELTNSNDDIDENNVDIIVEDEENNELIDSSMLNLLDVLEVDESIPQETEDEEEIAKYEDVENIEENFNDEIVQDEDEQIEVNEEKINVETQDIQDESNDGDFNLEQLENEDEDEDDNDDDGGGDETYIQSEIENVNIEEESKDSKEEKIEEIQESQKTQEELPYSQNDNIPIVNTDDLNEEDKKDYTKFREGDKIYSKKYGTGTIEKILSCNDKYLFSIQFEEQGRKLLNPQLAVVELVERA